MFDQMARDGMKEGRDFEYNKNDNIITFVETGSQIFLMELNYMPSDPNYDRLGSYEFTWTAVDEAQQVEQKAKNILRTRTRYKLRENGLIAKQLLTCNPSKGYLYSEFYKPHKKGDLPKHKKFLQSLVTDNPFIDPNYIETLKGLPLVDKERLLFGNWEYDDDPAKLIEFEAITDIFTNVLHQLNPQKYMTADISRLGDDYTVIAYWEGFIIKKIMAFKKSTLTRTSEIIEKMRNETQTPLSHVIVDEDGVGGGVKDILGCKGFVANSRAKREENYVNLKSQCYFLLAKKINDHLIRVETENEVIRNFLIEELEQVKRKDPDKDGKLAVIPKDDVKDRIGRSPDFSDTLMMRMYFDLIPRPNISFIKV